MNSSIGRAEHICGYLIDILILMKIKYIIYDLVQKHTFLKNNMHTEQNI